MCRHQPAPATSQAGRRGRRVPPSTEPLSWVSRAGDRATSPTARRLNEQCINELFKFRWSPPPQRKANSIYRLRWPALSASSPAGRRRSTMHYEYDGGSATKESVVGRPSARLMPDFQHSVSVAVTVAVAVAKYVRITFIRKNSVRTA